MKTSVIEVHDMPSVLSVVGVEERIGKVPGSMRPLSIGGFIVGLLVTSPGWGLLSLIMASIYNCRIETKNLPT